MLEPCFHIKLNPSVALPLESSSIFPIKSIGGSGKSSITATDFGVGAGQTDYSGFTSGVTEGVGVTGTGNNGGLTVGTASGFDGATGMIAGFGAGSAGFCYIVGATTVFGNGFVEGDGDGVGVGLGDGVGVGVGVGVGAIGEVFGTTLGVTKGRGFPAFSATVGVTIVLGNSG